MSATAAIVTLGCKTNQFESAALGERLAQAGYRVVPFEQGAALVIVNTCTVTAATDAESRSLVRRARRLRPDCRVVVTGCYAQVDPQALAGLPGVSLVLGNQEKADLLERLARSGEGRIEVADIRAAAPAPVAVISGRVERHRAFVQIQNGCDAFCSYCIIPHARGPSRSVPATAVVDQVRAHEAQGIAEAVLTGIHIGGYGLDLAPPLRLAELVRRLLAATAIPRLRLGSVEPTEIDGALIELLAASERIAPHLHIPLQSGDDAVLRRMNRSYDRAFFRDLVLTLTGRIPDLAVCLDVIVGFPGECEAEFANTLELLADLPLHSLHVFPFSRRPGTPAAAMPGQIAPAVVKERAARLRALSARKLETFAARQLGRTLPAVLVGARRALTGNYLTLQLERPPARDGLFPVRLTARDGTILRGVPA